MSETKGGGGTPFTASLAELVVFLLIVLLITGFIGGVLTSLTSGGNPVIEFFSSVFSIVQLISTLITMAALAVAVYAYMRISEISAEETKRLGLALNWNTEREQKNARWAEVERCMSSLNPSDWKIAILEADNILDQIVERLGYPGTTLGERMKHIEASDFPYLEEAWTAHKMRNSIAHKGTVYELSRSEAEQTINVYYRIFKELGYL